MWGVVRDILTVGTSQWYETLPFVFGAVLVIVEFGVRIYRSRKPVFQTRALAYAFSEGISLVTIATYGMALVVDRQFASQIADKNNKVLVLAMFVALLSIVRHLADSWAADDDAH